jgi:hypothetical protein
VYVIDLVLSDPYSVHNIADIVSPMYIVYFAGEQVFLIASENSFQEPRYPLSDVALKYNLIISTSNIQILARKEKELIVTRTIVKEGARGSVVD